MALEPIGDIADASLTEQTITEDITAAQNLARRATDLRATVIEDDAPAQDKTAQYLDRRNFGSQTEVRN